MSKTAVANPKPKMITQSTVLSMGFTKAMIEDLLPKPILKTNPYYRSSPPMKLWEEATVLAVMDTEEYHKMWQSGEKRRNASEKAVETKRAKAEEALQKTIASIEVQKVTLDLLRQRALSDQQDHYDDQYDRQILRGNYDYDCRDAYSADEQTQTRWMVNFARHNMTTYDNALDKIAGKVGHDDLYFQLKSAILQKIAETYPELAEECSRQYADIDA